MKQSRSSYKHLPMNKHCSSCIQPILNELDAGWEVLQQIFVVNIVNLDDLVLEGLKLV
jgi:hypothetical protein